MTVRCRSHNRGGRAVGGWVVSIHRAQDLYACECCSDVIEPGRYVFEVEVRDEVLTICSDCAGQPW